jgi:hypothetical protein
MVKPRAPRLRAARILAARAATAALVLSLASLVSLSSGCSGLTRNLKGGQYDKRATHFEGVKPNETELSTCNLKEAEDVIKNMGDWINQAHGEDLEPADRDRFIARMTAARQRYRLAAARVCTEPRVVYALLLPEIDSGDDDVHALMRKAAEDETKARQAKHRETGTYFQEREAVAKSSEVAVVDGRVVKDRTRVRSLGSMGNCVFARAPFPAEGQLHPNLAFSFEGNDASVYVRCYVTSDMDALPAGARVFATVPRSWDNFVLEIGRADKLPPTKRTLDFVLRPVEQRIVAEKSAASHVMVELIYVFAADTMIVVEKGRLRLRPDIQKRPLAQGSFFWERDPKSGEDDAKDGEGDAKGAGSDTKSAKP